MRDPYRWVPVLPSSRTIFTLGGVAACLCSAPRLSGAQDTSRVLSPDSLLVRVRALEAAVDVLQKQLNEQAASAVQTRSRAQFEITGRVVMNAFSNERGVNNVDNPQFVKRDSITQLPVHGFGMAVRQTMLGARLTVPDVAGGTFAGVMDVDFYGGQQPSSGGRTFPLLRIRTAHGTLKWPHAEILAGQEIPLFSPLNPISPAAVGTPEFVGAGNLWLWLPQLRVTGEVGSMLRVALQGAVVAPASGDPAGTFDTDFDPAERSRRPAFESRVRVRMGEDERMTEIGCAVHVGWVEVPGGTLQHPDSSLTSRGVSCDERLAFTNWLELRGEIYSGRLLRGLGGGAIGQGVNSLGQPIGNLGFWAQINLRPVGRMWSAGMGCGDDSPDAADVAFDAATRQSNRVCAEYVVLRPAGPTFIGGEARQMSTKYRVGTFKNNHLNVAIGFEF